MPNWCYGYVKVSGRAKDIKKFCRYFLYEEETEKEAELKKKYFARSFMNRSWKDFKKDMLDDYEPNEKTTIEFSVDFAWSCTSCIIEGYPQQEPKKCVTLEYACKKCNVRVEITTEEEGCCFEEHIVADKTGIIVNDCIEMPSYKCYNCGNEQSMPTNADLDDRECCECGEVAWKDKLVDICKKKLGKLK